MILGLYPPNKAPNPPKLQYENCKSVQFSQFLECEAPLRKRKALLLKTFW